MCGTLLWKAPSNLLLCLRFCNPQNFKTVLTISSKMDAVGGFKAPVNVSPLIRVSFNVSPCENNILDEIHDTLPE